ncbi:MAG: hypothetical protein QM755_12765 [Luteolibacter sp.]
MSPLPFAATEGGREGKRFTDAEVNRYRLYDFYRRQADYHLANPSDDSTKLLAFPGLDGGRRGHWGGTNEKDSAAYSRSQAPDFGPLTGRKGAGELYQLTGTRQAPGILVFDSLRARVKTIYGDGYLAVPEHPFGLAVDRFGFALDVQGTATFTMPPDEWTRDGKAAARFAGYYLNGESVVFRVEVDKAPVLNAPAIRVSADGKQRFFVRNVEFLEEVAGALDLALPIPAGESSETSGETILSHEQDGVMLVRRAYAHSVVWNAVRGWNGLSCEVPKEGKGISISTVPAHGRLVVASWIGDEKDAEAAHGSLLEMIRQVPEPSTLIKGGGSRFPQIVKVSGHLNADPEASGGSYEVDDIPVPSANPYRVPMTLSGLAFDREGTAFACTLVGDVWKLTGLQGDLSRVEWKRYATGLDLPMGIEIVDGVPYVNVRRNILRLIDLNGDGEADFYERFNQTDLPTADECGRDLRRDATGNFYFNTTAAIYRLSADGKDLQKVGHGARNPLGLAVREDGLVLSDSSEGNIGNGTCTIYESDHPENATTAGKLRRILYLPRGVDNSPGSRLFMNEPRFGPLGHAVLGTSFGMGRWYYLLRDVVEGSPQAALVPMPGSFSAGTCRIAAQPLDGQVFVAGLDGWGDYATSEGCLHRIRYTGKDQARLSGWEACRNGMMLHFDHELSAQVPDAGSFFARQWNYVDSSKTYGSPEYSVADPGVIGHDRVKITSVTMGDDRRSLFLAMPSLLPAMCTQIRGSIRDASGVAVSVDFYATLNRLHPDSGLAPSADAAKASTLTVPEKDSNGDTYQNLVAYFDRLVGRDTAHRQVAAEIPYRKEDLNYRWIRENLVNRQCLPCHASGTQHDFTTYEGMMRKVNLKEPSKSVLHGMISTSSMPPYPLAEVSPGMRRAIIEWIKAGAPE